MDELTQQIEQTIKTTELSAVENQNNRIIRCRKSAKQSLRTFFVNSSRQSTAWGICLLISRTRVQFSRRVYETWSLLGNPEFPLTLHVGVIFNHKCFFLNCYNNVPVCQARVFCYKTWSFNKKPAETSLTKKHFWVLEDIFVFLACCNINALLPGCLWYRKPSSCCLCVSCSNRAPA